MLSELPSFSDERCMCHLGSSLSPVVVSLSSDKSWRRARPSPTCFCSCARVCLCVCERDSRRERIRRGQGLGMLLFLPIISILCLHSCNCQISRKMTQSTASIYCFTACKILKSKYKYLVLLNREALSRLSINKVSHCGGVIREIHYFYII